MKAALIFSLCTLFTLINVQSDLFDEVESQYVMVETSAGRILGKREGDVNSFLGIPFAEPPIESLRFRPPIPKSPWYPSLLKALELSPECLQSTLFAGEDDGNRPREEDCLYLNIWQPAKRPKKFLYPVLIWVYGGAFMHGGASKPEYQGDKLARKGVVVVSFNYRLGALGFLVSTADGLHGNYGLGDQRLAVQWVQDHIERFGGDPRRVTLFGESAGAMSVGLHLLDQQRRSQQYQRRVRRPDEMFAAYQKLFHAVILQSNPLGYKYRSVAVANFIGSSYKAQLDCEDLRCLQSESPEELMHVQDSLMAVPRSIGDFFTWGPVVTDASYYREVRLRPGPLANVTVRQPIEALKELRELDVPVVIGTTSHEGTVFVFSAFPGRMNKLIYQTLVFSFFRTSAPQVLRMYAPLARRVASTPFPDFRLVLARVIGDYLFRCPNQYFASQLTGVGTPVFLYEFALPTRTPGFSCCDGLACHTCELAYTFNQLDLIEKYYSWQADASPAHNSSAFQLLASGEQEPRVGAKGGPKNLPEIVGAASSFFGGLADQFNNTGWTGRMAVDAEVARLMSEYWTTFAKYGDPNGQPALQGSNGFMPGTRPPDAPLWPRLLGDLPVEAASRPFRGGGLEGTRAGDSLDWERSWARDAGTEDPAQAFFGTRDFEADLFGWQPQQEQRQGMRQDEKRSRGDDGGDHFEGPEGGEGDPEHGNGADKTQGSALESFLRRRTQMWEKESHEEEIGLGVREVTIGKGTKHQMTPTQKKLKNKHKVKKNKSKDNKHESLATESVGVVSSSLEEDEWGAGGAGEPWLGSDTGHSAVRGEGWRKQGLERLKGGPGTSGFNAQKFMHQLVFDRQPSVFIIENDCVCNNWNLMEYRF